MTSAGLDLKNPGGKEYLVVGGAALGLGLLYFWLKGKSKTGTGGAGPGVPGAVPASGHGLGMAPANQSFLPGGASHTGNAFTDTVFTTPATSSPGMPGFIPPGGGPKGGPPTRQTRVSLPVLHVPQGAQSILGGGGDTGIPAGAISSGTTTSGGNTSVPLTPVTSTAATTTGLSGSWQGSSLFTSPVSPLAWANSILTAIPAPQTAANQQSLIAWALNEGGGGSYNPLNTTQGSQYPAFNSVGVRNFPNWNVGAQETAATIRNGFYPNILAGLQSGKGVPNTAGPDLMKWSGSGYSGIAGNWQKAGAILAAAVKAQAAAALKAKPVANVKPATPAQIKSLFPIVKPRPRPAPRRAATRRAGTAVANVIARAAAVIAATVRGRPPPRPAYRPVPLHGPGHPLLH